MAMRQRLWRGLLAAGIIGVVGYFSLLGFMMAKEDSLVFSGASLGAEWGPVPPDSIDLPWDTLRVEASDGVPVFLLESRLESEPDAAWVIFFHGNGLLVGSGACIDRYRLLRETGFHVLAVEFRGYGMSAAGIPSEGGVYADGRAAWDYLTHEVGIDPSRILLYGWSLGSGVAIQLASQVEAGGLITEAASTSLPDVAKERYWWLPVSLIMRNRFDNLARAGSLTIPWLLFHSRNDEVAPFSHAEALASTGENTRLIELNTGHNGGVVEAPEIALPALRSFGVRIRGGAASTP